MDYLPQMGMPVATKSGEKPTIVWKEDETMVNFAMSKGTRPRSKDRNEEQLSINKQKKEKS